MMLTKLIEFTNLNPSLNSKEIKEFVLLAAKRQYRSVVLPYNCCSVAKTVITQNNLDLKVVTVFGFPFDKYNRDILHFYNRFYDEIDVLIPIHLYYYNYPPFLDEIEKLLKTVRSTLSDKKVKFIIETTLMRDKSKQIKELCKLASNCNVDVIKTCSGIIKTPSRTFQDLLDEIKLIKKYWKKDIKASGGIRTIDEVKQLAKLGVKYIGTSTDIFKDNIVSFKGGMK